MDFRKTQNTVLDRYGRIPPELKYDQMTPLDTTKSSLNAQRLVLYLFSLENSFILHKAAKKRPEAFPEPDFLKICAAMFSAVIRVWVERQEFESFTFLLSWFVREVLSLPAEIFPVLTTRS
jgi:hypothetical protein